MQKKKGSDQENGLTWLSTGPIVRITPDELHIKDPEFYEVIYAPASKKRDKYASWTIGAGAPTSTFATVSHDHHRLRRSGLNPFFSKNAISNNASALISDKVGRLCQRFSEACKAGEVVRLDAAYMALTMDIITHYAFGESYNHLAEPDFKLEWKDTVIGGSASGAFIRQFPWVFSVMKSVPLKIMSQLAPEASLLLRWQKMVRQQVDTIIGNNRSGSKAHGTIFQALLDSDLPPEEKSADRLQDEAQTLVGAGSETTAKTLTIVTFYLLQNKQMLEKLRQELSTVDLKSAHSPQDVLSEVERLPYMVSEVPRSSPYVHANRSDIAICRMPSLVRLCALCMESLLDYLEYLTTLSNIKNGLSLQRCAFRHVTLFFILI